MRVLLHAKGEGSTSYHEKLIYFFGKTFIFIANDNKNTVRYGLETICYRNPYLWARLPGEYKRENSARKFKEKIKTGNVRHVSAGYAAFMNKI